MLENMFWVGGSNTKKEDNKPNTFLLQRAQDSVFWVGGVETYATQYTLLVTIVQKSVLGRGGKHVRHLTHYLQQCGNTQKKVL